MSAVWWRTAFFLCLCYPALVVAETKAVVWKNVGESITIQCRKASDQDSLEVKKGLDKTQIFSTTKANPQKKIIIESMAARVQIDGEFPNVDILIKNLSVNDMGPYWCVYTVLSGHSVEATSKGSGSVLLVVTENKDAAVSSAQGCESPPLIMVVVAAVGVAVVMLIIVLGFVIRIILRHSKPSVKPSRVANNNNDVYEDMRGTIRR